MTIAPAFAMPISAAPPAPAPGPAPPSLQLDEAVLKYRQLRDKKGDIQDRHKAELQPYNEALEQLNSAIMYVMQQTGQKSAKTENGTAFTVTRTSYTVADAGAFNEYVEAHALHHLKETRISKDAIETYIAAGNPIPPGVKIASDVTVNIRK